MSGDTFAVILVTSTNKQPQKCSPTLTIQQQIVDELQTIETNVHTIQTRVQQLKREKELFRTYGQRAELMALWRGYEWKPLGEVCTLEKGKILPKASFVDGNVPVIGGGRKPTGFHNISNRLANTILVSSSGSYAGFVSRYDTAVWASDCFSVHPMDSRVTDEYVFRVLHQNQQRIYDIRPPSAGQPHLYIHNLAAFKIPLPTPAIQQQCIAIFTAKEQHLQTLDERIQREEQHIADLQQLGKDVIAAFCSGGGD